MTDKTTDNEEDFSLNHFEQDPGPELDGDSEQKDSPRLKDEYDSSHTADLFPDEQADKQVPETGTEATTDSLLETTRHSDLFTEADQGKKEPIIPDNPGFQAAFDSVEDNPSPLNNDEAFTADNESGETVNAPPLNDDTATDQRSGIKPITIFAVVAMLSAATAIWFNPGAENGDNETTQNNPVINEAAHNAPAAPVLNSDSRIQHLEQRMSLFQQQSNEEIHLLKQQVEKLEQDIASLKKLMAAQSKQTRQSNRPSKATARTGNRTPASTIKTNTGWVVNLMSLDSLTAAKKALQDFKSRGINGEIGRYTVKGKNHYRIRVAGFASKQEAETHKTYLIRKYHLKGLWVHKPS